MSTSTTLGGRLGAPSPVDRGSCPPGADMPFLMIACVGLVAAALSLTGAIKLTAAMEHYQWGVLSFFIALDMFTALVVGTGVLDKAAVVIANRSRGNPGLVLLLFSSLLFLVSSFLNNLTAVLVVLPVIFVLLGALRLPRAYVVSFFSLLLAISNLAGASTPVGDFPALIIMKSGLTTFQAYLVRAFPLFAFTGAVVIGLHFAAHHLRRRKTEADNQDDDTHVSLSLLATKYRYRQVDTRVLWRIAAVFIAMFIGWATIPADVVPPELTAVLGLGLAVTVTGRDFTNVYRAFDLKPVLTVAIMLFVASIIQESGLLERLAGQLQARIHSPVYLLCAVMVMTAICSGLFSAGPAAAAMMPLILSLGAPGSGPLADHSDWLAVAFAAAICAGSSLFVWSATAGFPMSM
ncbi:MAG: hypothetical protein HON70_26690, partial [Lentisphaerae bacterium]|nr:hypothetical protein [Lentisphaerota bacterium]